MCTDQLLGFVEPASISTAPGVHTRFAVMNAAASEGARERYTTCGYLPAPVSAPHVNCSCVKPFALLALHRSGYVCRIGSYTCYSCGCICTLVSIKCARLCAAAVPALLRVHDRAVRMPCTAAGLLSSSPVVVTCYRLLQTCLKLAC